MSAFDSSSASGRPYAANVRFLQRTQQLGVAMQQAFAQDALRLWGDFLEPSSHPQPVDAWAPFGTAPSGFAWDAVQRGVRYAAGISAAAVAAMTDCNRGLQAAIAEWQQACPPATADGPVQASTRPT